MYTIYFELYCDNEYGQRECFHKSCQEVDTWAEAKHTMISRSSSIFALWCINKGFADGRPSYNKDGCGEFSRELFLRNEDGSINQHYVSYICTGVQSEDHVNVG